MSNNRKLLKLLYIVNARIPTEKAHGYQICKMCEEFSNLGVDIQLWVPTRDNPIEEGAFNYYNIKRNFKINYVKSYDFLKFVKHFGKYSFYLQSLLFLIKLVFKKADKDSVIYTRNPEIVWLFKLKGFKTGYECHDWFGQSKKISLFLLKRCDYIITTNNFIKKEFIKNKFNSNRILVAPNGVDLNIFDLNITKEEAVKRIDIEQNVRQEIINKTILLYTGSFKTMGIGKGIKEILEALKILNRGDVYFIAVGGSEKDIKYYNGMATELDVSDKACFLARRSQKDLALFQKVGDIMLMPFPDKAHYRYFMTPLKIFEYMASQRPIIASDLPSIREVLNEKNCLFCQPGKFRDLADKIILLFKNKELADRISTHAYQDVQNHTWQKRAKRILNFMPKL